MDKLISTSLNGFKRGQSPKDVLDIGKVKDIEKWLECYLFKSQYKINRDLTIDIRGDFLLESGYTKIPHFPDFIKFNKVSGSFVVIAGLMDMIGCPEEVGREPEIGQQDRCHPEVPVGKDASLVGWCGFSVCWLC